MRRTEDLQRELANAKSNADFWKGKWDSIVAANTQLIRESVTRNDEIDDLKRELERLKPLSVFDKRYQTFADGTWLGYDHKLNTVTVSAQTWQRLNDELAEKREAYAVADRLLGTARENLRERATQVGEVRTALQKKIEEQDARIDTLTNENTRLSNENAELKRRGTAEAKTEQSDDAYQDVYNQSWKGMAVEMNEQPPADDSHLREIALNAAIASGGNELSAARFLKFLKGE